MKDTIGKILENREIGENVYKMVLIGDFEENCIPGQFVNIKIPNFYLRRPISLCDFRISGNEKILTVIYKVLGKGTEYLSKMKVNESLSVLNFLGNGFKINREDKNFLLIAGGIGLPPMYYLAKNILKEVKDAKIKLIAGFNKKEDIFYQGEFKDLGVEVFISTVDGSFGEKGIVTDFLSKEIVKEEFLETMKTKGDFQCYYACGPKIMLKNLDKIIKIKGQLSLEERMGCGFGACMGCNIETIDGSKRVCKDGPVFESKYVIWE